MIFEILLFHGKPGWRRSRVDKNGSHLVRGIDSARFGQEQRAIGRFHDKAGLSKRASRGFKIAGLNFQVPRPQFLVAFPYRAPRANDPCG